MIGKHHQLIAKDPGLADCRRDQFLLEYGLAPANIAFTNIGLKTPFSPAGSPKTRTVKAILAA